MKGIYKSSLDVDVILEDCPITIVMRIKEKNTEPA